MAPGGHPANRVEQFGEGVRRALQESLIKIKIVSREMLMSRYDD